MESVARSARDECESETRVGETRRIWDEWRSLKTNRPGKGWPALA